MYKKVLMILFFVLWTLPAFGQIPHVDSSDIEHNEVAMGLDTTIWVYFDTSMNGQTINDTTFVVNGWLTGWHRGTVTYNSDTYSAIFDPESPSSMGKS